MSTKSKLNVVMGAMTFGEANTPMARVHDLGEVEKILDVFQQHGHKEVDTARVYCNGTSEEYLGKIGWQKRGLIMETKLFPNAPITHKAEDIRRYLDESLAALQTDKIEIFYLHAPDRNVPFEETLRAVDEQHRKGKFARFGLSNFYAWEVAEVVTICRANGYIVPTAYQGVYNAVQRAVEPELFPALRKYGIAFYEYNPLAGGLLAGRYHDAQADAAGTGARFDPTTVQGKRYRERYWRSDYFAALKLIDEACQKAGLTMAEVALRWVSHHSLMEREHGDSVIVGASSLKHLEQNLLDLEKGPLPQEILDTLDQAWYTVKRDTYQYWR